MPETHVPIDHEGSRHLSRLREAETLRLTDVALIRETWETISQIPESDISDRLYHLTSEAFERWAPNAEMEATRLGYVWDENREREIASHAEFVERRARLRKIWEEANNRAAAVPDDA